MRPKCFSVDAMDKIRVCLIIPGGIGTGKGNIGIPVLEELVQNLARDVELTVFSLFKINDGYEAKGFVLTDVQGINLPIKSFVTLWKFWRIHHTVHFDVVHGCWALPCGFLAVWIGKLFSVRSVVSVLGGDAASLPFIRYGQLRTVLQRKLVLWTLHQADRRTALTKFSEDHLKAAGLRKEVTIIPWGVNTEKFRFIRKPLHHPVRFLHIANLSPVKDQATLLKAFQLISKKVDSELVIMGEGPLEQALKSLAVQLGIQKQIVWMGIRPYEDLPQYYHQSDILLLTSFSEGQSEVATEAMSSGVVVCGTRVGLLSDVERACVAVDIGNFQELARQVLELLEDQPRMEEMRMHALDWALGHSIGWTAEHTKRLYEGLTDAMQCESL